MKILSPELMAACSAPEHQILFNYIKACSEEHRPPSCQDVESLLHQIRKCSPKFADHKRDAFDLPDPHFQAFSLHCIQCKFYQRCLMHLSITKP